MTSGDRRPLIRQAIKLFELQLRVLELARADPNLLLVVTEMLEYIRTNFRVNEGMRPHSAAERSGLEVFDDQRIARLSGTEVENILLDESLTRKELERIAVVRFGIPKGSLKSLGSKDGLRDKISNMLGNERVHRAIGEVAGGSKTTLKRD